jgi:uncharacterized protein YjbI with pentapeptide repeats
MFNASLNGVLAREARLEGATLFNVDLRGADLEGASLRHAVEVGPFQVRAL